MHRNLRKLFLYFLLIPSFSVAFSIPVFAVTLSEYREKVSRASDSLAYLTYPEEDLSDAENIAAQRRKIAEIRTALPANDKVELPSGSFEVDNRWLHEKLGEFEREPPDSPKRTKIINELSEKLSVLAAKLTELENQSAGNLSKDEEKRKLSEILKRPEYQKPEEKQESVVQKAIKDFIAWIRSLFPRPQIGESPAQNKGNTSFFKPILQIILFLVVFGIIGFLLYRFVPVLLQKFRERERREKETRVILGETLKADETPQTLFTEAEKLARNGDLRAAIRKGYIALLCELSDRKIIGLARHKTNRDYLRDLRRRENLYREMQGLTTSFERHWYGFGKPVEEDWENFRKQYREAVGKSN